MAAPLLRVPLHALFVCQRLLHQEEPTSVQDSGGRALAATPAPPPADFIAQPDGTVFTVAKGVLSLSHHTTTSRLLVYICSVRASVWVFMGHRLCLLFGT